MGKQDVIYGKWRPCICLGQENDNPLKICDGSYVISPVSNSIISFGLKKSALLNGCVYQFLNGTSAETDRDSMAVNNWMTLNIIIVLAGLRCKKALDRELVKDRCKLQKNTLVYYI